MTEETPPTDNGGITIQDILAVGKRIAELDAEIAENDARTAAIKATRDQLARRTLPDMMKTAGMTEARLADGRRLALREFYVGRITDETAAFAWLAEHNCAGIIKETVAVAFPRGMAESADKLMEELRELPGVTAERKKSVHPQTLNKFVNEQMTEHPDKFPEAIFGVTRISEVAIK